MSIIKILENRSDELAKNFLILGNKIKNDTIPHLKEITSILTEYDSHDDVHSDAVLKNIENLIGSKLSELNTVELFLLWISAYLHDIGMALPKWEIELLRKVEIENKIDVSNMGIGTSKMVTPITFQDAVQYIQNNKSALYNNYEQIKDFIFLPDAESKLIEYLANELKNYQIYRFGYTSEFKDLKPSTSTYEEVNESIRKQYIRDTHHKRAEKYIKNLKNLFENQLNGKWSDQIVIDLSNICRAHCEEFTYIEGLNIQSIFYKSYSANIQFISILLRLADVLHFCDDRAPKSLFSEKMITSAESKKHWSSKNNTGLNYTIDNLSTNSRKSIVFSAYCENPQDYYFINDYLDWIDEELQNYDRFIQNMRYDLRMSQRVSAYDITLPISVERNNINYDKDLFVPAPNLKFTLEQRQVLQLLMGVNLYKDKNIAIRELYQNSLDACRVLLSKDKIDKGSIRIGIDKQVFDNSERSFLYCHDNGTGMSKYIIENYFLKIGKSYYKSRDFDMENVGRKTFHPTSQFGIGILSCFMIGEKIEIITKALNNDLICFVIDGPYERFYYKKPDEIDVEKISDNGTLVKVYLNDEFKNFYTDCFYENIKSKIYIEERCRDVKIKDEWDRNIYKILLDIIGDTPQNIEVRVKLGEQYKKLISHIDKYDLSTFKEAEIQELVDYIDENPQFRPPPQVNIYQLYKPNIKTYKCHYCYEGTEIKFLINLPTSYFTEINEKLLTANNNYSGGLIFIDGIRIQDNSNKFDVYNQMFNIIVNFVEIKPQLSVDRKNITEIPSELMTIYNNIPVYLCKEIFKLVCNHLLEFNLTFSESVKSIIWNYLSNLFPFILPRISDLDNKSDVLNFKLSNTGLLTVEDLLISEYFERKKVSFSIKDFVFNKFDQFQKYLFLGKAINAQSVLVDNKSINITSETFTSDYLQRKNYKEYEFEEILIKCDNWLTKYSDYDLVTAYFPLIPKKLFNLIKKRDDQSIFTDRTKVVPHFGNTLIGIAHANPLLIDNRLGISIKENRHYPQKEEPTLVRKFYQFKKNIHFPEFWGFEYQNNPKNTKKDIFLYLFVSPIRLTETDNIELKKYKNSEPEYCKGVREGWSILFLGDSGEFIIKPGLVSRDMILNDIINISFKKKYKDFSFSFVDGSEVSLNAT